MLIQSWLSKLKQIQTYITFVSKTLHFLALRVRLCLGINLRYHNDEIRMVTSSPHRHKMFSMKGYGDKTEMISKYQRC